MVCTGYYVIASLLLALCSASGSLAATDEYNVDWKRVVYFQSKADSSEFENNVLSSSSPEYSCKRMFEDSDFLMRLWMIEDDSSGSERYSDVEKKLFRNLGDQSFLDDSWHNVKNTNSAGRSQRVSLRDGMLVIRKKFLKIVDRNNVEWRPMSDARSVSEDVHRWEMKYFLDDCVYISHVGSTMYKDIVMDARLVEGTETKKENKPSVVFGKMTPESYTQVWSIVKDNNNVSLDKTSKFRFFNLYHKKVMSLHQYSGNNYHTAEIDTFVEGWANEFSFAPPSWIYEGEGVLITSDNVSDNVMHTPDTEGTPIIFQPMPPSHTLAKEVQEGTRRLLKVVKYRDMRSMENSFYILSGDPDNHVFESKSDRSLEKTEYSPSNKAQLFVSTNDRIYNLLTEKDYDVKEVFQDGVAKDELRVPYASAPEFFKKLGYVSKRDTLTPEQRLQVPWNDVYYFRSVPPHSVVHLYLTSPVTSAGDGECTSECVQLSLYNGMQASDQLWVKECPFIFSAQDYYVGGVKRYLSSNNTRCLGMCPFVDKLGYSVGNSSQSIVQFGEYNNMYVGSERLTRSPDPYDSTKYIVTYDGKYPDTTKSQSMSFEAVPYLVDSFYIPVGKLNGNITQGTYVYDVDKDGKLMSALRKDDEFSQLWKEDADEGGKLYNVIYGYVIANNISKDDRKHKIKYRTMRNLTHICESTPTEENKTEDDDKSKPQTPPEDDDDDDYKDDLDFELNNPERVLLDPNGGYMVGPPAKRIMDDNGIGSDSTQYLRDTK